MYSPFKRKKYFFEEQRTEVLSAQEEPQANHSQNDAPTDAQQAQHPRVIDRVMGFAGLLLFSFVVIASLAFSVRSAIALKGVVW